MFKSGFVSIVGRPNVGKSTLLAHIVGEKISIISDKPQTTRNRIQIIMTTDKMQAVFVDTPGIQMPKNALGEYMLNISKSSLEDMDIITVIVDTSLETGRLDAYVFEQLEKVKGAPIILIINKIDTVDSDIVDFLVSKYSDMGFQYIVPLSALNGDGVETYLTLLQTLLPEGPQYFPSDMITDQTERFLVSEFIREKTLIHLRDEIPHGIQVEVEEMKEDIEKDLLNISAVIYVEKKSHKGMVIGRGGQMLRKIGIDARKEIETFMGVHTNLQLWVKIEDRWREKKNKVKGFGYR